jgi:hypothetical protein
MERALRLKVAIAYGILQRCCERPVSMRNEIRFCPAKYVSVPQTIIETIPLAFTLLNSSYGIGNIRSDRSGRASKWPGGSLFLEVSEPRESVRPCFDFWLVAAVNFVFNSSKLEAIFLLMFVDILGQRQCQAALSCHPSTSLR